MQTYLSDAIIADGKQLLQTMHTLCDAQRKASTIVNEQLLGITLIPETSLWLYRATKVDDISYFYVCKRGEKPSEVGFERRGFISPFVIIPLSAPLQTIWRTYLLSRAVTQLPTHWHGSYSQATFIFDSCDMESIRPIDRRHDRHLIMLESTKVFAHRDWSVIAPIEELQPKVMSLDASTHQVVCCYWNDWIGLVRETVTYIVEDARIMTTDGKMEILYPYHCGVIF